jgi:hypothetical protein
MSVEYLPKKEGGMLLLPGYKGALFFRQRMGKKVTRAGCNLFSVAALG